MIAASTLAMVQNASADPALSLRLNWKMKGEFAPFIVAAEKGFFKDEGLDLDVKEGSGATLAIQSVATGKDAFAYVPSVQLIQAVNKGVPIKAVATVSKVDSMGFVARPGVTLATPKDLEGKKVEIAASSTFHNIWDAFARKNGIDASKVDVVSVNPGARFGLLLSGKVDILADIFITNELPVLASQTPEKLQSLAVGDFGFPIIGYTLITTNEMIEKHPDEVKKFVAAARKGFEFTREHPEEAAKIASAAYPAQLPDGPTRGQVDALDSFLSQGSPKALFVGSDEGWQNTLDILAAAGVIDEKKAPSDYYTNAFVSEK
ncbi:ABC transporter substrate-binding protein [Ancylobacter sp. MQZ15Z-1]|uniref:ABC transporter substrate-binding protein n=1 Tax=Ancylobacter mangrovi TaxID=2972472 RepID=A0A9X2PHK1_9HYPH|nr:ABC transporter substrate-binding protein [Ancylobacter mangrovi]MCS0494593.1 ABC transporter substrate-binding protein [Ancylobacter mangrovi]